MVLVLLVATTAACTTTNETTISPNDKATNAERKAAGIEREVKAGKVKRYNRRACWHEKRVMDLKEWRWRARHRHAEKAAAWWRSIATEQAKECEEPIPDP
jgi:hypothetical protein